MVQRHHLLKYIGLILPFRKSISHTSFFARKKAGQEADVSVCLLSGCYFFEQLALRAFRAIIAAGFPYVKGVCEKKVIKIRVFNFSEKHL